MRTAILASVAVLFAALGLLPIIIMVFRSLVVDGELSLFYYRNLLSAGRAWTLARNSFALATLTTLLTVMIGIPLGLLLGKSDLPLRRFFTVLFAVPLVVPPYVIAVSWFAVLGREGLLGWLVGRDVTEVTSTWLFGVLGCVLVLFSAFLPLVVILTISFLRTINPRLEEAARLSSSWVKVLWGITVPLISPGLALAAVLVFLLCLGEFSVPTYLRFDVFPVECFTQFSAFLNFSAATAAAVPLALVTLVIVLGERILFREQTSQLRPSSDAGDFGRIPLGPWRPWLAAAVELLCLVLVLLPLAVLLYESWSAGAFVEAGVRAGDSLVRSLGYAATGASMLTVLGFFVGYTIHTRALPFWRAVDSLSIFLFALPSTVVGMGLISLWNRPATQFVYTTPLIILLGYVTQYTVLTSRIVASALAQIPPSMEEAAQVAGAGWPRRIALILAPQVKRALVASWLVAYLFCLRDLGISLLVYPPGQDTLPVRIFTLMANAPPGLIAALCVLMIAGALLPWGLFGAFTLARMRAR